MSTRILAVDYGERRIGLAVSDPGRIVASPLATLDTRQCPDPVDGVAQIAREQEAGLILVGYPLHLDGRQGEKALKVDAFTEQLGRALPGVEIRKVDERYSSVEAHAILRENRSRKKGRLDKKAIDRVAAAVILQEFLDGAPPLS